MDHFGIGAAIKGVAEVYFRASGGTGRTTSLVDSVKDDDRVVFVNRQQANLFEKLCKEREINIETVVCDPQNPSRLFERGSVSGDGRLIFDHVWIEEYYLLRIQLAANDIGHFQKELGGFGKSHRDTQKSARELSKWVL